MKTVFKTVAAMMGSMLAAHAVQSATIAPSFEEYREPMVRSKPGAKAKIASDQDREFKTRIAEAWKQEVNFAGYHVLSTFGCGASCLMSFALDKNSGKVSWLPFTICCWNSVETTAEPLAFKKDSRLVVVTGSRNERGKGVYYYEFKQRQFVLIRAIER